MKPENIAIGGTDRETAERVQREMNKPDDLPKDPKIRERLEAVIRSTKKDA